nr:immunoglobulin heavy chain junction region [Macaca mulatta]
CTRDLRDAARLFYYGLDSW